MEHLEPRILLGGDHPSFELPLTPTSGTEIVLDGMGEGSVAGEIEDVTPDLADDLFRFTAPQDDFVTVWADTVNAAGGSELDSRVEVFTQDGMMVAEGSSQGMLTGGFFADGWVGFLAEAGETYFVRVLSDVNNDGDLTTGGYDLRVDAIANTDLAIETDPMAPPPARFGAGSAMGSIDLTGDDEVFRVQAGSDAQFDALASFFAAREAFPPSNLDTRIDVYDAEGNFLTGDSRTGRLNTGFAVTPSAPDATFFVRIRSDEFTPGAIGATGDFTAKAEMVATDIEMDPVTRRGSGGGALADAFDTRTFDFVSQGEGVALISSFGAGLPPLPEPAVRLYDAEGNLIGFDDQAGRADLQVTLEANTRYFVVVETFDNPPGGGFVVAVESNITTLPTQDVDDHVDRPGGPDIEFEPDQGFTDPEDFDTIRPRFQQSTPLIFGDPELLTRTFEDPSGMFDPVVNPISDRSFVQTAQATGRTFEPGDTDLFQFTVPVDMLGQHTGDNDDAGDALFAGGQGSFIIKGVENGTLAPITRDFLGIWDAQDWWPVRAGVDATIRAMTVWDPDGDSGPAPEALIIGGEFGFADFQPSPFIAAYAFNPMSGEFELTPLGAGLDGTVHALDVFDTNPSDDNPPELIIGGEFTGGITTYSVAPGAPISAGAFAPLGTGPAAGNVFAIEFFDPNDPMMGDENLPGLFFAGDGGVIQSAVFDDEAAMGAGALVPGPTFSVSLGAGDGTVHALQAFTEPQDMGDAIERLAIGGEFDDIGGLGVSNVANIFADPEAMTTGAFTLDPMGGGTDGPVFALEVWDRDGSGMDFSDELIVGGDFTTAGGGPINFIGSWQAGVWAALGSDIPVGGPVGFNAPVHSLLTFVDQEFGVGVAPNAENPVLYAGGDFTLADGRNVSRMAQLVWDDFNQVYSWQPMGTGSTDTVFAMQNFNDELPAFFDRDDRTAARLRITVSPEFDFNTNTFIRIYDSQFRVVYTNDTINPPFPDPSGAFDPSLLSPDFGADDLVIDVGDGQESQFWAGEVYYLEVSNLGGTGRYGLTMTADALPPDITGNGVGDDVISAFAEPVGDPDLPRDIFDQAPEITLNTGTNGDGRNFLPLPTAAFQTRAFDITPSGFGVTQFQELGVIENVDDFDVFFFRAPQDGTVEVRTVTQQIQDEFVEQIVDFNQTPPAVSTTTFNKTLDSPLDSMVRIFDNDLVEVASNNDNAAFAGVRRDGVVGQFTDRVFNELDARAVAEVQQGEQYFIVVQSGQFDAYMTNPDLVDWRHATGGFELLVNTMPNLQGADDHADLPPSLGGLPLPLLTNDTAVPIDDATGNGSIRGEIRTRSGGVEDNDGFIVFATGTGTIRFTATADNPGEFAPRLTVFGDDGQFRDQATANSTDPAVVEFFAQQGERFIVRIDANLGDQGQYTLDVDGPPAADDFADRSQIPDALPLEVLDFLGSAQAQGNIERAGDTDLFRFTSPGFDFASVSVESTSFGFDPQVRVFEVSEDPAGNAVLLQIAFNDNRDTGTVDAQAAFPITGPDRTSLLTGKTFNEYYILVEGADGQSDAGTYTLNLSLAATDDHPDEGQFSFASPVVVSASTGQGDSSGMIEVAGDTDLFTFTAPAGGQAVVSAISNESSTLRPTIRVFDQNFNPVTNLTTGTTDPVTGPDAAFSAPSFRFNVVRQQQYFVLVGGATGSVTTDTGAFTLEATTPTADDHANETEFDLASEIVLSTETGAGQQSGSIATVGDTDLFFFETIADGRSTPADHTVRLDASGQSVVPVLEVFDSATASIIRIVDGGAGDESTDAGVIETTITATGDAGQRFFLLASIDSGSMFLTGDFAIEVEGPLPDIVPDPDDDHADRGQFSQATAVPLDARTGDASAAGRIEASADSDLFVSTALAQGRAFVQVVTPGGSLLDVRLEVFERVGSGTPTAIASDTTGFQGVNAAAQFDIAQAGAEYFFLVSGLNSATGEYTVRIDTEPQTFFLYYPEGFAGQNISEFVSIANPSDTQSVTYSVRLFYENPDLAPVTLVDNEVLAANSRGGVTISDRGFIAPGVVENEPYSIVVESDGQLGATFSHYDANFDGAIGEAFTPITSEAWTFARLERNPGSVESFVVLFNPNPDAVTVTLTAGAVQFQQRIEGNSRGGWELSSLGGLPLGVFGATVTSEAADAGGDADLGIVAALSQYDTANDQAFGVLGDPTGGSTLNAVPSFTTGGAVDGEIVLFNPGDTAASVTITSDFVTAPLPDVTVVRTVEAGQTLILRQSDLSISADQTVGLSITSTEAIAGVTLERQNGDANATAIQNNAASTWFFGDAFINSELAGQSYFETLSFFNPTDQGITVDVRLFFNDGTTAGTSLSVGGGGFNALQLHEFDPIINRQLLNFFSIEVSASVPIVTSLSHFDLFLGGGWSNAGAPLGLLNPLDAIRS